METAATGRAAIASPDRRATEIGAQILRDGGNAVDAAVAANLALGVLMPFACGYGGDLLAMVWDGQSRGYLGAGGAPADATPARVRELARSDVMPRTGPLPVTVPGAVDGWFALLEAFGSRSFGELSRPAHRLASEGFELTELAVRNLRGAASAFADRPDWQRVYGGAAERGALRQTDLARTIEVLADDGPEAYYRGEIAAAIAQHVQDQGGLLTATDLAEYQGEWVAALRAPYRDTEILQLPPPTQGVTALEALRIVDVLGDLPDDEVERTHRLVEAAKLALVDRWQHVGDPRHVNVDVERLLGDRHVADRAAAIDPQQAGRPDPARPVPGGTVYLCVIDANGLAVSLSQSNFLGFGSGLTVPGWGINLHGRAALVRLDGGADVIAPRKRPLHTLIPAMAMRGGQPVLVFGTMGGDNQVQIHLQLLARLLDDRARPQDALDAPRWQLSPADWSVGVEAGAPQRLVEGLRGRGHAVHEVPGRSVGWAKVIQRVERGGRFAAAFDPRTDGSAEVLA